MEPDLARDHDDASIAPSAWLLGTAAGVWAAVTGYALLAAPVLVAWAGSGAEGSIEGPLQVAGQAWLVTAGAEVAIASGRFGLAPLLLSAALIVLVYRAGSWSAHVLGQGRRLARHDAFVLVMTAGVGYAAMGALGAGLCATSSGAADPVLAAVTVFTPAAAAAAWGVVRADQRAVSTRDWLPARVRRSVRAALIGAAALLAFGALLTLASLLTHLGQISAIARALDAGVVGGLVVTLGGAAYLPNAAVWAAAFAVGPGFSLGTGTTLHAAGVSLGTLPGLPVLGAVPQHVPLVVGLLALLIPLLAGGLAGWSVHRGRAASDVAPSARGAIRDALMAGALSGLAIGLACIAASGPAGPSLLAHVGPVAWQVALAASVEVGLAAAVVAGLTERRRRNSGPPAAGAAPAGQELVGSRS